MLVCRLAIACYLVFLGDCDAHEAVLKVRLGRPGALQTRQQEHFVEVFQMYITHLRYHLCLCVLTRPWLLCAAEAASHFPFYSAARLKASSPLMLHAHLL